jgi:hypothetical protein
VATIVTPETVLAWHRLIAKKYDGAASGGQEGCPWRIPNRF